VAPEPAHRLSAADACEALKPLHLRLQWEAWLSCEWQLPSKSVVDSGNVLGVGSFGCVTRGTLNGSLDVALKAFRVDVDADAGDSAAFEESLWREAMCVACLRSLPVASLPCV
jgi:hypothetical protein